MLTDDLAARMVTEADRIGTEHGKCAATWIDLPEYAHTARAIIGQIDDYDPMLYDTLPCADLSGQFADGFSSRDLADHVGLDYDEDDEDDDSDFIMSDVCDAYNNAYDSEVTSVLYLHCVKIIAEAEILALSVDMSAAYGYGGAACRILGVIDGESVAVCYIGDDREFNVTFSDLDKLADDEYCLTCGQLGHTDLD